MKMLAMADTNGDKAISQAEFRASAEARFAKADANSDGTVTAEERKGSRRDGWRKSAPPHPTKRLTQAKRALLARSFLPFGDRVETGPEEFSLLSSGLFLACDLLIAERAL